MEREKERDAEETPISPSKRKSSSKRNKKLWEFHIKRATNCSFLSWSCSSLWNADDKYLLSAMILSFFLISLVIICTLLLTHSSYRPSFAGTSFNLMLNKNSISYPKRDEYSLHCTSSNTTITCPPNYPPKSKLSDNFFSNRTCPEYFRWIHEDLKNWKEKGITRDMVEDMKKEAHFRLVIVNGTAYVEKYEQSYQTRDVFTLWGILQLLRLYPGRIPDLDLMFLCNDITVVKKDKYPGEQSAYAPPLFHYCGDESAYEIVFPDWSFWGWPEINIKPWIPLAKDLKEGNSMQNWTARKPYAFWKGTVFNGRNRIKLAECASIEDWNAEIIHQSWDKEERDGFKTSNLKQQCVHRYKIYIEGFAWSVSEKYILACNSMTLRIEPVYYDFITRSLIPMKHYWPINPDNLCKSIKFAVNWGNNNTDKAQEIGKAASDYIFKNIRMEHVYDYMFHVLTEYAKLLKYKPTVPEGAVELCSEKFACSPAGLETAHKIESTVNGPSEEGPCNLPPPYDPDTLQIVREQKSKIRELVEWLENASG